ncbi:Pre-mRNA-processing factor 19 (Neuronal differentiation-related gene protein) (PRP19/PSO4 homolog) (RING-type E3 ubiquitin transferase PRP19) [Durusdinium trenchii]|uniref:Pre-mRNA-processing factor 19 n=1 Tax=Durusdinium trenchii TaxID=1381693 RepID=A0ABP0IIW6_9DINO
MSALVCAISGAAPEEPVFSPKTGQIYEKRLIEKHISESGKCPVTKEELQQEDLCDMKVNKVVKPRPASATSIPGMLTLLQSEWDALMSETYDLKTNLDTTRKQLSHALYQHDAACRVIARLLRERDAARSQVAQLQDQLSNSLPTNGSVEIQEGETGLSSQIVQKMEELAQNLAKTRKQRKFPELSPLEEVKRLKCVQSHSLHHSTAPGVLCVDIHKADPNRIVSGGMDCQVLLYNAQKQKMVQKMVGHSKKVTAVKLHGDKEVIVSASQDATAKVWTCSSPTDWSSQYNCLHTIRKHRLDVTDLSIHPLGDYLLTASLDKSWAIHDFATGRCVRHMKDLESAFPCMSFHPDGLIVAGGTEDKSVIVWDVKNDQATVATLLGHESAVQTLSFSGNGYYLASGSRDGVVKLWDLRKPVNLQTIQVEGGCTSVCFDATGQYLAVSGSTVQVFNFEAKTSLTETIAFKEHTDAVTGLCWGPNAKTLASVSMDKSLKLYSAK